MRKIKGETKTYKINQNDCYWSMICRLEEEKRTVLNDDDIQNKRGVYIFFDCNDKPLRIGKAVKLRNRLLGYYTQLNNYYTFKKFQQDIFYVSVIYTNSEKESVFVELDLLEKHKPKYNNHNA